MSKSKLLSILIVAALMLASVFALAACVDEIPPVTFTVTFDSDGGSDVPPQTVDSGAKATEPADPTKEDFTFCGWYQGESKYKFDSPVTEDITLTAHWRVKAPVITHTVTFNTDGGSEVKPQTVEDGKLAVKPADPVKEGCNFANWADGSNKLYDFTTPVTEDITLTAEWDPKQYTVAFDTDGGSNVESRLVTHGSAVVRPENPVKDGFYFEGWYVDDVKYDFEASVTNELTVKAKWSDANEIDAAFVAALKADYSNFTSHSSVTEEGLSLTDVFKQTSDKAYWIPESGLYNEHLLLFAANGSLLANYYLSNGEWIRSSLVGYADFVVALCLDEITLDDVEYCEGVYHVVSDSIGSVIYALFRSNDYYESMDIYIEDGRIVKLVGELEAMTHVQTFTDFGATTIVLPDNLPKVKVEITTRDRELEEGGSINVDELVKFIFSAKVEDKDYAITSEMIDLGGLDVENPSVGNYTITLTIETWDGEIHSKTATVLIKAVQQGETFADVFGKDYGSVTITTGSATVKRVNNAFWLSTATPAVYFVAEDDANHTLSMYKESTTDKGTFTRTDGWNPSVLRVDLLFALNADLFEQVNDTNEYIAKNNEAIVEVLTKTCLTKTMKVNTLRDYSVTLTVQLGRISKVVVNYYSLAQNTTATASNGNARTVEYTLTDFGTTQFELPQGILEMRGETVQSQQAILDDKR